MGKTVEELNFKLILDDKDFDGKVAKAKKDAADLNIELSKLLEIKKNAGTLSAKEYNTLKRLDNLESNRRINAEKEATATARRVAVEQRITQEKEKQTTAMASQSRMMGDLTSLATQYLSIWGAGKLLKELVNVTGEFEMQRTTLRAMLQDAQGADAIYEQIKSLAVVSPFSFKELVTYTKQLAAYSVPIGDLYDTTKMLADVSAGLGVGMDRLVLAYGQVRSAAFLRGQEVRQFTEAGIPILDMLAKQFEEIEGRIVSTGEVFDRISKRQVPFEMVARAFQEMTSEGGKFYNMQEIQADTLKGKISNLTDAYEIMFSELGDKLMPVMKGTVDAIRNLAVNYESVGKTIIAMAAAYGVMRTALGLYESALTGVISKHIPIASQLSSMVKWVKNNPYVAIAAGVAILAGALYKVVTAQDAFTKAEREYKGKYAVEIAKDTAELDSYYTKIKNAKEGTDEYNKAKTALFSRYGDYIQQLKDEGRNVDNLTLLYDGLRAKIEAAGKARLKESATAAIGEAYGEAVSKARKETERLATSIGAGDQQNKELLWQIITGGYTKEQLESTVNEYSGIVAKINEAEAPKQSSSLEGTVVAGRDIWKQINKITSELKENQDAYTDAALAAERFFGAASGGSTTTTTTPKSPQGDEKAAVKRLKNEIAILEKLKEIYTDLKGAGFDDESIENFFATNLKSIDRSIWEGFNFEDKINNLILALERLGEKGDSAADTLETKLAVKLAKSMAKSANEAQKATDEFNNFMMTLLGGGEVEGEGASYKISKIVADYKKATDDITDKAIKAREKLQDKTDKDKAAGIFNQSDFDKANKQIDDYVKTANGNALVKYSEEGRQAIKALYKEWRDGNLDFNNLSDKTIGQLRTMRDAIAALDTSMLPEEAVNNLRSMGISLEDIEKVITALANGDLDKLNDELKDNTWERVGKIADYIKQAAGALREYAEAAGNDNLASLMEGVEGMAEIVGNVAERLAKGDIAGAVVAGVSTLFQQVMKAATAAAELRNAIAETRMEAERLNAEAKLSDGVETLFGESTIQRIRNAVNLMKEYESVVSNNRAGANRSITWRSGLFNWGRQSKDLQQMMNELGYDLYDAYGNLNANGLQAILGTYENLTTADRKWIEEAIKNTELYTEAMQQLDEVIKDTFSNIVENMADKLIDARLEIGDAYEALAGDLQSVFGDMANEIAHKLVTSFIVDNILSNYSEELRNLYSMMASGNNKADIAEAYATMVDSIITDSELAAEFTNRLYDALEQSGLNFDGGSSDNLADGIKGITEDTADLWASYLNAIRADVSYAKVQRDEILKRLDAMAGFVSTPTLVDYLTQIQANTFNTAEHTRQLLMDIQSMMTSEGGFTALRVYS